MKSVEKSINDSFYGDTPEQFNPKYNQMGTPKNDSIGPGTYAYNVLLGKTDKKEL